MTHRCVALFENLAVFGYDSLRDRRRSGGKPAEIEKAMDASWNWKRTRRNSHLPNRDLDGAPKRNRTGDLGERSLFS